MIKESLDKLEKVVEDLVAKLAVRRPYMSETEKIRPRVMEFINKDMTGVDIGCGNDKIFNTAIGIDGREIPGVDVVLDVTGLGSVFGAGVFEYVYSSHCLEHVKYPYGVLKQWVSLVMKDGLVVLYLPHKDHYMVHNPEHLQQFDQQDVERMLEDIGCDIVCSEMDLGYDRYSFLIVGKKRW
jgi:hypothetical protein